MKHLITAVCVAACAASSATHSALLQSTYFGGSQADEIRAIAVHPLTGEIIIVGTTQSTVLPATTGATYPASGGNGVGNNFAGESFVSRLSPTLTGAPLQTTFFGGAGIDLASVVAIHPVTGDIYIAGSTTSSPLPGTVGGSQSSLVGSQDAFVVRFNATLTGTAQATYFGGAGIESVESIVIHPQTGEILIGGYTTSIGLPGITAASSQPANAAVGGQNGFIARLSPTLTGPVLQSTFFGGSNTTGIRAITIHPGTGEVLAGGFTQATTLPASAGGMQPTLVGGSDAFIARLDPTLTGSVLGSTFFGGTANDSIRAIAVHPVAGEIYVFGETSSSTLPGTTGAGQTTNANAGIPDLYVARFSATLTGSVLQTALLGAGGIDIAQAFALHPLSGEVIIAGQSNSSLPGTANAIQPANGGSYDAYVARFNPSLRGSVLQTTFLGSNASDAAYALAIQPTGEILIAGSTFSAVFPGTTGGTQPAPGNPGNTLGDGFVARLTPDLTLNDTTPSPFVLIGQYNVPLMSVRTSNAVQITGIAGQAPAYATGQPGSTLCVSSTDGCSCNVSVKFVASFTVSDSQFVCVRHTSAALPDQITSTVLHVGAQAGAFHVTTGSTLTLGCVLDIDGNGTIEALNDGLMFIRAAFGLTGTAVTNSAIGAGATRSTWAQIRPYLNNHCGTSFGP